ncbi:MAG: hypothetical protein R2827_15090 [Bdellovibrionales bacterium]
MKGILDKFKICDEHIRSGRLSHAKRELSAFELSRVPRKFRVELSQLFIRAGMPEHTLRLLNRTIHSKEETRIKATDEERIEYASGLIGLGLTGEAQSILESVNVEVLPKASLNMAFVHFTNWEYDKAIPHLLKYLNSNKLTDYQRVVGLRNLLLHTFPVGNLQMAEGGRQVLCSLNCRVRSSSLC